MRCAGEQLLDLTGSLYGDAVGLKGEEGGAVLKRAIAVEGLVVGHKMPWNSVFEELSDKGGVPSPGNNGVVATLQPLLHERGGDLLGGEGKCVGVEGLHDGGAEPGKEERRCGGDEMRAAVRKAEVVLGVEDAEHG